ncbi:HNH endonuclease [Cytobacillus horneckiae]|uniref:HNH endonuclease n=1 Tax=Cytobacillus horneckiae TaxID=549687 RepID=UPI003D9AAC21
MCNSPSLRAKFSPAQQSDILAGNTTRNYAWHHHQNNGATFWSLPLGSLFIQ